jgi:hypothetical protein
MTVLKDIKPSDKHLYSVQMRPCVYFSHIEASNAKEAIEIAAKDFKLTPKEKDEVVDASSEPIYEASIGLETDLRDNAPCDLDTSNGVFEIRIRGCDMKRVNELKKALMLYIGFMGADEEDERLIGKTGKLERALEDVSITGW